MTTEQNILETYLNLNRIPFDQLPLSIINLGPPTQWHMLSDDLKERVNKTYLHGTGWTIDDVFEYLMNNFYSTIDESSGMDWSQYKLLCSLQEKTAIASEWYKDYKQQCR